MFGDESSNGSDEVESDGAMVNSENRQVDYITYGQEEHTHADEYDEVALNEVLFGDMNEGDSFDIENIDLVILSGY